MGFHTGAPLQFRIRDAEDLKADGDIHYGKEGTWESRRYYKRKDGFGYSMHHTILYAGKTSLIHYKNHIELVFIFKGQGEIEVVQDGQKQGEGVVHKLYPGACYALDQHDRHFLTAYDGEDLEVCW